jgi:phosphohistidine phosphatase SixA
MTEQPGAQPTAQPLQILIVRHCPKEDSRPGAASTNARVATSAEEDDARPETAATSAPVESVPAFCQSMWLDEEQSDDGALRPTDKKKFEDDRNVPCKTDRETTQAMEALCKVLFFLEIIPRLYLTSWHLHADQTATAVHGEIAKLLNAVNDPRGRDTCTKKSLYALTPHCKADTFSQVITEVGVGAFRQGGTIALVGHTPRIDQFLERLTGERHRPIARGEAVLVCADSLDTLVAGKGIARHWLPVAYHEDVLRDKLATKMTVSTLLAGFTFSALIGTLNDFTDATRVSLFSALAVWFFIGALLLFMGAVYTYDELRMPGVFWRRGQRQRGWRSPHREPVWGRRRFDENRQEHGLLYAHMVWPWKWMFTPAVWSGIAGIVLILLRRSPVNTHVHWSFERYYLVWFAVIGVTIMFAFWYTWRARPAFVDQD